MSSVRTGTSMSKRPVTRQQQQGRGASSLGAAPGGLGLGAPRLSGLSAIAGSPLLEHSEADPHSGTDSPQPQKKTSKKQTVIGGIVN